MACIIPSNSKVTRSPSRSGTHAPSRVFEATPSSPVPAYHHELFPVNHGVHNANNNDWTVITNDALVLMQTISGPNDSYNADDGWKSSMDNVKNVYNGQPYVPQPQLPNNVQYQGTPMNMLPNGCHPHAHGPPWVSSSSDPHAAGIIDNRFSMPVSPVGPFFQGGYPVLFPVVPPTPTHHEPNQYYREDNKYLTFPHPHAPIYVYRSSQYNNYFPVQPYEPFTDISFALNEPFQAYEFQSPCSTVTSLRNGPHDCDTYKQLQHPTLAPEPLQHPAPSFEYLGNSPYSPHLFFPSPHVMLSPPMPQSDIGIMATNQQNEDFPPHISSPPKKLHSPTHVKRLSPTEASAPTSGNTRIARRVNNLVNSPRSALLEEFRTNRDKKWELKAIFEHVVEFSGDQHGSRFIQQQLEEASEEVKEAVFNEVLPKVNNLVQDVFGNYVIQRFFEFGTQEQINILAAAVEEQAEKLSVQIYGCRVIQKALESISSEQQSSIIRRLEHHILACIKDAHGNHVVQKLVEIVSPERLTFLPIISNNILELSTHPYGCRVLQRCLEHLPAEYTRSLLDAIHCHTIDLMKDQYGNYVIQFILDQGQDHDKAVVLASIRGNLIKLAQHKYASNVCEKALICTDSDSREILIDEIMKASSRIPGESPILVMVKDQYANYVLQRALTLSEGAQREAFFHQVKPLLVGLRKSTSTYSRPLVSMERLMDAFFNKEVNLASSNSTESLVIAEPKIATAPRRSL